MPRKKEPDLCPTPGCGEPLLVIPAWGQGEPSEAEKDALDARAQAAMREHRRCVEIRVRDNRLSYWAARACRSKDSL